MNHFLTNQNQIDFNSIQKVELDSFFFFVKTGPNPNLVVYTTTIIFQLYFQVFCSFNVVANLKGVTLNGRLNWLERHELLMVVCSIPSGAPGVSSG